MYHSGLVFQQGQEIPLFKTWGQTAGACIWQLIHINFRGYEWVQLYFYPLNLTLYAPLRPLSPYAHLWNHRYRYISKVIIFCPSFKNHDIRRILNMIILAYVFLFFKIVYFTLQFKLIIYTGNVLYAPWSVH
jgi:hypothetical protein